MGIENKAGINTNERLEAYGEKFSPEQLADRLRLRRALFSVVEKWLDVQQQNDQELVKILEDEAVEKGYVGLFKLLEKIDKGEECGGSPLSGKNELTQIPPTPHQGLIDLYQALETSGLLEKMSEKETLDDNSGDTTTQELVEVAQAGDTIGVTTYQSDGQVFPGEEGEITLSSQPEYFDVVVPQEEPSIPDTPATEDQRIEFYEKYPAVRTLLALENIVKEFNGRRYVALSSLNVLLTTQTDKEDSIKGLVPTIHFLLKKWKAIQENTDFVRKISKKCIGIDEIAVEDFLIHASEWLENTSKTFRFRTDNPTSDELLNGMTSKKKS